MLWKKNTKSLEIMRLISKQNKWIFVAKALVELIVQKSLTCGHNILKDFPEG